MIGAIAALALAAAPALRVDTAGDRALPCGAHAALGAALRERLPGLRLEGPAASEGEDLSASVRRERGAWVLELRRAGGALALQRRLSLGARDCALLGQTGALVIDRWLEEIRWAGRPPPRAEPAAEQPPAAPEPPLEAPPLPLPDPLPPLPTAAPSSPAPAEAAPAAPASAPAAVQPAPAQAALSPAPGSSGTADVQATAPAPGSAPAPEPSGPPLLEPAGPPPLEAPPLVPLGARPPPDDAVASRLVLGLGPALWLGLPGDARFSLAVEAALRRGERLRLGLSLLGTAASGQAVTVSGDERGQLSVRSAAALVSAGLCGAALSLELCAGPLAGARLSSGSAAGPRIFQGGSALLLQAELGAGLWLSRALGERLELSLDLAAAWIPGSASFTVAGAGSRDLSSADLSIALRLGWKAF